MYNDGYLLSNEVEIHLKLYISLVTRKIGDESEMHVL